MMRAGHRIGIRKGNLSPVLVLVPALRSEVAALIL